MEGSSEPNKNEFDYSVTFPTPLNGLKFGQSADGGVVVTELISDFAKLHTFKGSLVCGINDKWVKHKSFEEIMQELWEAFQKPPATLRFRVEKCRTERIRSSVTYKTWIFGAKDSLLNSYGRRCLLSLMIKFLVTGNK